jgi:hypothetical protein
MDKILKNELAKQIARRVKDRVDGMLGHQHYIREDIVCKILEIYTRDIDVRVDKFEIYKLAESKFYKYLDDGQLYVSNNIKYIVNNNKESIDYLKNNLDK